MFASGKTAAVASAANYIEDVFSSYLYDGNGSSQTITNGIDLSGKGGLVWVKCRPAITSHVLTDSANGAPNSLNSDSTAALANTPSRISSLNSNGFSVGSSGATNDSRYNFASWTFRKQPKFFDVVTYTGNGTNGRTVAHSLGSTPGCIIVKRTDAANGWAVYHRAMNASPQDYMMRLNATDGAFTTTPSRWNNTLPTSTEFTLSGNDEVNGSGATYVAYLFAHNAGGFGLTGTDNVISCGSFTTDATGVASVNLGYEPQWALIKKTTAAQDWVLCDTMRGWNMTTNTDAYIAANTSTAESNQNLGNPTATGFDINAGSNFGSSSTYIYIAIRRGPMKVPTSGTSVYNADTTITATTPAAVSGFVTDLMISTNRTNKATYNEMFWSNRLTANGYTSSTNTTAEQAGGAFGAWDTMNGSGTSALQSAGVSDMAWMFRRAPSFFDEVCYTGTGSTLTLNHNLGVVPELIITKKRVDNTGVGSNGWIVMSSAYAGGFISGGFTSFGQLQSDAAIAIGGGNFLASTPTSTTFSLLGTANSSTNTFVAYLFATCTGVSKVGSYTGNGSTQTINCGFTGGARFVLIKRTDSTGDWYVWDSARGIVSGNDPYLLLNSTAAEVTNTDYIDPYSAGFEISSTAPAAINASGGTFIFLAIA